MLGWLWPERCVGCEGPLGPLCAACAPAELFEHDALPEGVAALWHMDVYGSGLGAVIRRAKYRPDRRLAHQLATALGEAVYQHVDPALVDVVVPVPSTAWTRFRRGFALASLLAHVAATRLERPYDEALRLGLGRRQAGLSAGRRRDNLRGRVGARHPVPPRVLLVDDVVTTGATAQACAQELLRHGASEVRVVAVCLAAGSAVHG